MQAYRFTPPYHTSPVRSHYGELMRVVDEVLERESFDDAPLRSLKQLCVRGVIAQGLQWTLSTFVRFHREIEEQLRRIVSCGATFEEDQYAEEQLQRLLERHQQIGHVLSMTPS